MSVGGGGASSDSDSLTNSLAASFAAVKGGEMGAYACRERVGVYEKAGFRYAGLELHRATD